MIDRHLREAWLVFVACAIALVALRGRLVTTGSIDFAAHLALVDFISNNMDFPRWSGDYQHVVGIPYLGVMTFYPPIGHAFGAVAGWVLRSEIAGMNALALLSVFAIYIATLQVCFRTGSLICASLFTAGALWLGPFGYVHGGEIIGNYFYAQVFGSAVMLWLLYVATFLFAGWAAVAFAVVAAGIMGWVYSFAAILFAGCFLLYLGLETLIASVKDRAIIWHLVIRMVIAAALLLVVTAMHPEFKMMVSISNNDGGFMPIVSTRTVSVLAASLMLAGAIVAVANLRSRSTVGVLIGALALGISSVYALQWIALQALGLGSPYALKKYLFGIVTILCLSSAYLLGRAFDRVTVLPSRRRLVVSSIVALTITLWTFTVAPYVNTFAAQTDITSVSRAKRYAANTMMYRMPADAYGATVALLSGLSTSPAFEKVLNLSISNIEMGMPFQTAADFTYERKREGIRYALAPITGLGRAPECRRTEATYLNIVAVDYACADAAQSSIGIGQTIETRIGGNADAFLGPGWAELEADGVWSISDRAVLNLKLRGIAPGERLVLVLNVWGSFPNGRGNTQRVQARIGKQEVRAAFTQGVPPEPIEIVLPQDVATDKLTVDLLFPDAVSPKELKMNDVRKFGVKLRSFTLRSIGQR